MLLSMTGYGKAFGETEKYDIELEVKSVNHRFIDIYLKLPHFLQFKELDIRKEIKNKLNRGSISLNLNLTKKNSTENIQQLNIPVVESYIKMLTQTGEKLNIGTPSWETIIKLPEIFTNQNKFEDDEKTAMTIMNLLNQSLDKLIDYRHKEGENLKKNLENHLQQITNIISEIKTQAKDAAQNQFDKLQNRINNFIDINSLNKERLEQELVLIVDKVDITEELNRLDSHVSLFHTTMTQNIPVGQKLNFLAQEMHREANTISSKTNLTTISHYSVTLREIIEKIREQVQNIE